MSGLGRLCQALLNGPCQPDDLLKAESALDQALAEVIPGGSGDASAPGSPWHGPPIDELAPDVAQRPWMLRALAPLGLLEGIWLGRAALPATGHLPLQNRLLALYTASMGLDNPTLAPALRYRAGLTRAGVSLPLISSPDFFLNSDFPDSVLQFALHHLTFFHRPNRYFPELMGYALAHLSREPDTLDDPEWLVSRSRYLNALMAEIPGANLDQGRLQTGNALYRRAHARVYRELRGLLHQPAPTAETRMAAILRAKLPHAIGYHAGIRLEDRSLDAWLTEHQNRPEAVVQALRRSSLINTACPAASRLIKAMDFGGAMFGVFSEKERETIEDWITDPAGRPDSASPQSTRQPLPPCSQPTLKRPAVKPAALSLRQLYTVLLACESPVDVPDIARRLVKRILRRTLVWNRLRTSSSPFAYSPQALAGFVIEQHRAELARYRPLAGAPKIDRVFCQWAILQLTPAVLVDGAWLAGIHGAAESLSETDRHLLKIYLDELGDGRPAWNHPNVHRKLLASQEMRLPDFRQQAFARHPALCNAAFELPVYLLAMGLLTQDWRPEMLGLNLAIEMSGLGAGYMRAIDILRFHGMDPTLIQLHLSIDNPASGHAARAQEAIALHLEVIRRVEGYEAMNASWRRIWLGYRSLGVASFSLATSLTLRYGLHRLGIKVDPASWAMSSSHNSLAV
jgi:hypothetical protein